VPIENPNDVVNSGRKAVLGRPIELALGSRGIRSIELIGREYYIVAGPYDGEGGFTLYKWSGAADAQPVPVNGIDFKDMHPEALFDIGGGKIQILSDDGERRLGGEHCKDLPEAEQRFRSIELKF